MGPTFISCQKPGHHILGRSVCPARLESEWDDADPGRDMRGGSFTRRPTGSFIGFLVSLFLGCNLPAQPTAHEHAIKAALLFNFSQFVEWPASALKEGTNAPFVIGILGADPFGKFLDELVKNERAHGKPIEVRRFYRKEEAFEAHILFVSKSEQPRIDSILTSLRGKPVLIVTEGEERSFPYRSGMIALVRERGKIRLHINLEAARAAGLTISAKLLRVADTVHTER